MTPTAVVAVSLPDGPVEVPVTISVFVPIAARVLLAVIVIRDWPVTKSGEKDALTPAGRLEALSVTPPENPFSGLIVT